MDLQIAGNASRVINAYTNSPQSKRTAEYKSEPYMPIMLTLDKQGTIQECSNSAESLFNYKRRELVWQHVSCLFPQLTDIQFVLHDRLNPFLNYICHCDYIFESLDKHGDIIPCNLNIFLIEHEGTSDLRLIVRPINTAES
jgi:hypothetical protein